MKDKMGYTCTKCGYKEENSGFWEWLYVISAVLIIGGAILIGPIVLNK